MHLATVEKSLGWYFMRFDCGRSRPMTEASSEVYAQAKGWGELHFD